MGVALLGLLGLLPQLWNVADLNLVPPWPGLIPNRHSRSRTTFGGRVPVVSGREPHRRQDPPLVLVNLSAHTVSMDSSTPNPPRMGGAWRSVFAIY
jgi:hypothetical protein